MQPCICLLQSQAFLRHHRWGQGTLVQAWLKACREPMLPFFTEFRRTLVERLILWSELSYDIVCIVVFVIYCWSLLRSLLLSIAAMCPSHVRGIITFSKIKSSHRRTSRWKTRYGTSQAKTIGIHRGLGEYCQLRSFWFQRRHLTTMPYCNIICPFSRWRMRGSERLNKLSNITLIACLYIRT